MLPLIVLPVFWVSGLGCGGEIPSQERECGGPGQPACPVDECGGPGQPACPVDECGGPGQPACPVEDCGGPGQPACPVEECGGPGQPACPVDERSCLELPVDECEARGCYVMMGHVYDSEAGCHVEEEVPVFCRLNDDVICGWEGDPIILTDPEGGTWYIPWSCFTTPEDWGIEYVPGGTEVCEKELTCLDLSVEECEEKGCEVMMGHIYDSEGGCHVEEEVPVFCRLNNDIICAWEGDPIILTDAEGGTWYISWSCFSTPEDWAREYVPGGTDTCE